MPHGGVASRPEIAFAAAPPLPQDEVLSRLLFGGSSAQLSSLQALQLAASLNALRGGSGGVGALGKLSRAGGLQNLRLQGANAETGQGVSVGAGKYITNNIYVDVLTDARGYTATQIEVALTPAVADQHVRRHEREHPLQSPLLKASIAVRSAFFAPRREGRRAGSGEPHRAPVSA